MILPRNLTRDFFNTISGKIQTDGESFLGQTHQLDTPVNLLCITQSDLPQNRILLEVLDGSIPVQYKHVCVLLVSKSSSESFNFKGKVFSFDRYKLVATKIRYLIVISNINVLEGDYINIIDKVNECLTFHPSLTITKEFTPIVEKPEITIYQKSQDKLNSDQCIESQYESSKTPFMNDVNDSRQNKIAKNDTMGPIQRKNYGMYNTISELSLYTPKWLIQARVLVKSDIRKFNGPRGESQMFTMDLCDSSSEIKAVLFGDAVKKWYSFFEEGMVYSISKGQIRSANKKFNHLNHTCELVLDEHAIIQRIDDDFTIPNSLYAFTKLSNLDILDQGALVDVIGVICQYKGIQSLQKKGIGGMIEKRDIKIVDDSGSSIWVSLWHDKVTILTEPIMDTNPIIALKNVKISDWQTRKLDVQNSTKIVINPKHPQSDILCKWWLDHGKTILFNDVGISGLEEEVESIDYLTRHATQISSDSNKQKTFSLRGVIEIFKENVYSWPACPGCRKKMLQEQPESQIWRCLRCDMEGSPNHTYMLSFKIIDKSQTCIWVTAMGGVGEEIMNGIKAEEMVDVSNGNFGEKNIANYFEDARMGEFIFKIRVQMESYLGESRIKYRVVKAIPVERVIDREISDRMSKITLLLSKLLMLHYDYYVMSKYLKAYLQVLRLNKRRANLPINLKFLDFPRENLIPKPLRENNRIRKIDLAECFCLNVGDLVQVLHGQDKGKQGVILEINRRKNTVVVDGCNMRQVFWHPKYGESGVPSLYTQEVPIHITNIALVDPVLKKPTIVKKRHMMNGEVVRISKISGCAMPNPIDEKLLKRPRHFQDFLFKKVNPPIKEIYAQNDADNFAILESIANDIIAKNNKIN